MGKYNLTLKKVTKPIALIKEHAGIIAILPNLTDNESVMGYNEIFLDKNIRTKDELIRYCLNIERQLKENPDEIAKTYLNNLKYNRENQKIDSTFSKLEQESIRGGEIFRDVWRHVQKNCFSMNTLGEGLFKPETGRLIIDRCHSEDDVYMGYLPDKENKVDIFIYSTFLSFLLHHFCIAKPKIGKKASLKINDYTIGTFRFNNILKEINRQILSNKYPYLKDFKDIFLNLPEIINNYLKRIIRN